MNESTFKVSNAGAVAVLLYCSLLLLVAQGLLNYFTAGTSITIWKQMMLAALCIVSVATLMPVRSLWSITFLFSCCLLVVNTIFSFGLNVAIYNIFFYIAWFPFFVLGKRFGPPQSRIISTVAAIFIVFSSLGLFIQLFTGAFGFLEDQEAVEYRQYFLESQRFGFWFVTSTGVMPALVGMYYLFLRYTKSAVKPSLVLIFVLVAVVPTGSLAAAVAGVIAVAMSIMYPSKTNRVLILLFVVSAVLLAPLLSGDAIQRQLGRVVSNDAGSVSNQIRLYLWQEAIIRIGGFTPLEHIFGLGLGATNANSLATNAVPHGESSFLQAYIEGGLLGIGLRLAPFVILAIKFRRKILSQEYAYLALVLIVCAVAPVFSLYGIQCVLGYIAGLAYFRGGQR